MIAQYRHPSQGASTNTSIVAAYGDGLLFQKDSANGTKIQEVLDGTSNTIAVYEAKTEIPWTKPEEVTIDLTLDKFPNFGFVPEGFIAGSADGSVYFI